MNLARLKPIVDRNWSDIKLIATDMDGTLTNAEIFDASLFETLDKLAAAGIKVLITTGRSAGWVQAIATYLPVEGVMAENGGLLYWQDNIQPQFMAEMNIKEHRQNLSKVFGLLKSNFPHLIESEDNRFRLTDWTFEVEGLSWQELEKIESICQSEGYGFTHSSIQCHIKPDYQDKAFGLNQIISQYFSSLKPHEFFTIGDSPNDESMFDPKQFPLSVGVANVAKYSDRLRYLPAYITTKSEGEGFSELAELIMTHASQAT
ncbi:MAG: HAD-IIB family hydrolase [Cyanobacteria bacterium P01_G01_bin.19]